MKNFSFKFYLGVIIILVGSFFLVLQMVKAQDDELPEEFSREIPQTTETFTCSEILLGKYFIDTKDHSDKVLSLLARQARAARQIYTSARELLNLSKECNSKNCAANCESAYGICFGLCEKTCYLAGPFYAECVEFCKELCGGLPKGCVPLAPSFGSDCKYPECPVKCFKECMDEGILGYSSCVKKCKQDCKDNLLPDCKLVHQGCFEINWFGVRVAHPCVPLTRDIFFNAPGLPTDPRLSLPEKLYKAAVDASLDFRDATRELVQLAESFRELQNQEKKIKEQLAVWFRERHISHLFDCYTLKDMKVKGQIINECPFEGHNLFHCK